MTPTSQPDASATGARVLLLDDDGQRAGTASKLTVHSTETPLHLAFSCYVFDAAGRVLFTRRALEKRAWPGVWTNSCCGHPEPGEDISVAVARRLREELGITPHGLRVILPDFQYRAVDAAGIVENEVCPVYVATTDDDPRPDPGEVAEWKWTPWRHMLAVARDAPWLISPWAALQIPRLHDAAIDGDD